MKHTILLFLISVILGGCQAKRSVSSDQFIVRVANNKFKLLKAEELLRNNTIYQNLRAEYRGNKYSINLVTDISTKEMKVIGLTEFGSRIFAIKYDNSEISLTSSIFKKLKKSVRPEYIIADMQLIYLPISLIEKNFVNSIEIKEFIKDGMLNRIFIDNGNVRIKVEYSNFINRSKKRDLWQSDIKYQNFERKYKYSIKNL